MRQRKVQKRVLEQVEALRAYAADGLTASQAATKIGLTVWSVYRYQKEHGINFKDGTRCHIHRKTDPFVDGGGRKQLAIRLDPQVYGRVEQIAQQKNISVSSFLNMMISNSFAPKEAAE